MTLGQTLWGWGARLAPQEGRTLGRSIGMQGGSVARPAGIWWESWLRGTGATHCVSPLSQRLRAKPASTVPTASSAHGTENCCWARDRLSSRLCPLLSVVLVLRTGQAWAHAEGGSRPRGAQASGPWDREGVSCPGRSCQGTACACLQKHRGGFFFFFLAVFCRQQQGSVNMRLSQQASRSLLAERDGRRGEITVHVWSYRS